MWCIPFRISLVIYFVIGRQFCGSCIREALGRLWEELKNLLNACALMANIGELLLGDMAHVTASLGPRSAYPIRTPPTRPPPLSREGCILLPLLFTPPLRTSLRTVSPRRKIRAPPLRDFYTWRPPTQTVMPPWGPRADVCKKSTTKSNRTGCIVAVISVCLCDRPEVVSQPLHRRFGSGCPVTILLLWLCQRTVVGMPRVSSINTSGAS